MQGSYSVNFSAGGLSITQNLTPTADTPNPYEVSIPAALTGQLTTRTDNDTGVVTVASGHGITTSHKVDLYDASGRLIRKNCDVTAVASTTVSIDAGTGVDVGSGTNLPTLNSAVYIARQVVIEVTIQDADIQIWGCVLEVPGATTEGHLLFEESNGDDVFEPTVIANKGIIENVSSGASNSLGNSGAGVGSVKVTNGNSTLAGVFKLISMEDRTP